MLVRIAQGCFLSSIITFVFGFIVLSGVWMHIFRVLFFLSSIMFVLMIFANKYFGPRKRWFT